MFGLSMPESHIVVKMNINGITYNVEKFQMGFVQPTDYKGQPQHETQGGKIAVTLTQIADKELYEWAKSSTERKNGTIAFQTDLGKTVLRIHFRNASCISLTREMNAFTGTTTSIIISPEEVKVNDNPFTNKWS